jgi:hypothetical protein
MQQTLEWLNVYEGCFRTMNELNAFPKPPDKTFQAIRAQLLAGQKCAKELRDCVDQLTILARYAPNIFVTMGQKALDDDAEAGLCRLNAIRLASGDSAGANSRPDCEVSGLIVRSVRSSALGRR